MPDSTRGYGIGFSIGNYGYVGLGGRIDIHWEYYNDFWQFDPSANSWTRKADFPGKARICATAFVIGNNAYIVCGSQNNYGNDMISECWEYNSLTDKWIQKHDFPGISRYCAVGFAIGKNGYVGTGYDTLAASNNKLKDFWKYDTATDTWTQKHNFSGLPRYCASGFALGDKGYICLGLDSAPSPNYIVTANDMWEYDTATDSWTQKSNIPTDAMGFAGGFAIGNNIYVGPGQQADSKLINTFWEYNTVTDIWTQQVNFPGGPACVGSAFAIGDTGYKGLGVNGDSTFYGSNKFFRFIPDSVTGVDKLQNSESIISIYPNPTSQILYLTITRQLIGLATLSIMDITGREVVSSQWSVVSDQIAVNVSILSSGMYFINVKTKDLYVTRKFIKQ